MILHDNLYWMWKSPIVDFRKLPVDECIECAYVSKVWYIFHFLGVPTCEIQEWSNGEYSCEYNDVLRYAFDLDLVKEITEDDYYNDNIDYGEWLENDK